MPTVKLTGFTGERPRIIPRLLPSTGAQSAINARLDDGSLTPYRAPTFVASVAAENPGTNLRSVGVNIGDAIGGGGLAAAFDNTASQALAAAASKTSSTTIYVGKNFSSFPRRIHSAAIIGTNDQGYVNGANPSVTITLYGKNGAAPNDATDGTALGTVTFTDTANESANLRSIASDNLLTPWDYVWVAIAQGGGSATMAVAEVRLFESNPTPETIYLHGETWLGFPGVVDASPGPVAQDRLYYTGDGKPKIKVGADTFLLKVPAPNAAPSVGAVGSGSGDVSTRIYTYTFVTAYGEESEPAPVSNELAWQPSGLTVTLTGIQGDPGGRNITHQRFYRSQTGQVGTDFYFIAERTVGNGDFVDSVPLDEFVEPLPSRHWNPPPDDLKGLTAGPNGMMAGFVGKQLYFCEPFRPHAWPELYVLTTDVPIVALGVMGTTWVVLTEGFPYRVTGNTPTAMVMEKIEASLPCVNARGVVDLGHAIAWPSTDGLAAFRGNGSFGLVSNDLFSPREWLRLNPQTMRGGDLNGRWIGSFEATNVQGQSISGSLIIDISGESFLIRSSLVARDWFHDIKTGFLYFLAATVAEVLWFDSPTGDTQSYFWHSKQFVLPKPDNFGVILIETGGGFDLDQIEARQELIEEIQALNAALFADPIGGELAGEAMNVTTLAGDLLLPLPPSLGTGVTVGVYADKELVATVGHTDRVARLPSGFLAREWEIEAFGDYPIDQITMARTADELKLSSGGKG